MTQDIKVLQRFARVLDNQHPRTVAALELIHENEKGYKLRAEFEIVGYPRKLLLESEQAPSSEADVLIEFRFGRISSVVGHSFSLNIPEIEDLAAADLLIQFAIEKKLITKTIIGECLTGKPKCKYEVVPSQKVASRPAPQTRVTKQDPYAQLISLTIAGG